MTDIYKVHINDRAYTSWAYLNVIDFKEKELIEINPAERKLFTNDIFTLDPEFKIMHSSIRSSNNIPGVMILNGNKTYGRSDNGKLLYKCVPDDRRLPTFLISYEMKNVGFSKVFVNQYVTINFVEWKDKHPRGVISQLIGPVEILDNFYNYSIRLF